MEPKCFWASWLVTLAATALLLVWSWPLSPFTTPGIRANEAVIIFLPVMLIRWLTLAALLWQTTFQWANRAQLSPQWSLGASLVILLLHVILGIINLGIMNFWLSVTEEKTRAVEIVCVAIYFGLPLSVLAIGSVLQWSWARSS